MLLRSIFLQLLLCFLSKSQSYESDYTISDDDDGKYTEGDQTDYSKYFNGHNSEPLEENSENGFVKPLEFSSFFSSPQFGLSSNNAEETLAIPSEIKQQEGFIPNDFNPSFAGGAIDYFDQAQKETKNKENLENDYTPGYISSEVPVRNGYQEEINDFRQKSSPYKPQIKEKKKEVEEAPYRSFKPSPVDATQYQPGYYKKYTQQTPYEKYGLQPQTNSYGLGPYNPNLQTTSSADLNYEYLPTQNLKSGECVKVNKKRDDKMTCYSCKNLKTGVKSEHCSYEQEPKAYYRSMTKTYNRPDAYRIKRDSDKEEYEDPYEEVKAKSHRYFSQPDEFRKKFYSAPDFADFEKYKYTPSSSADKDEDKSYSEIQSEAVAQSKDNCKEVKHEKGVTCVVCQDSKTGGSFEKCEYQSQPNEQKYAYVQERKYDGEPEDEKEDESKPRSNEEYQEGESEDGEEAQIPQHFVEVTKKHQKVDVRGLDPKLYGRANTKSKKYKDLTVFPKESKNSETRAKPEYFDSTDKRDVEKVLEEFSKKDRSNCKQIKKKGMTCYLCVDKKGIQNEECMYVSESQPQSSLIAYHQLERTQEVPKTLNETKIKPRRTLPVVTKAKNLEDSVTNASNNKVIKNKRKVKEEAEPVPEFDINDEGGLYSSETKPVYVKSLGMSLPKYMVEKTSFEKEFDQTVLNDRI
ncbi:hypothetical protein RN001_015090 [Aquatica leii]|uniref:Uncharacterized protein n=1 Tax=Aquatica leii TaxID=1421715 RepID=A0AAN7S6H9_9COLE|nr:hypothetical protein RN001_015090 [Aquatica leii]